MTTLLAASAEENVWKAKVEALTDQMMGWAFWWVIGFLALAGVFGGVAYAWAHARAKGHDDAQSYIGVVVIAAVIVGVAVPTAVLIYQS